jgi:hypothetical protein
VEEKNTDLDRPISVQIKKGKGMGEDAQECGINWI